MINLGAIEHHAFDNYCYALNENDLAINLRTGKDVEKVSLMWGDPFDWAADEASNYNWRYTVIPVTEKKELTNHLWWSITVAPKAKRCKYFFKIESAGESYVYGESGICPEEKFKSQEDEWYAFIFPWMNKNDICNPPAWAENTIWYQIFPSRFFRGKESVKNVDVEEKLLPWAGPDEKVNNSQTFGGNLNGITEKLDYLENLGVTGLYLNPVNCSTTQHKYDTTDYFDIDPDFGTKDDMKNMVREAHRHGIRVMLDGVFNHSGWEFFAWQDVIKNRQASKYADWYIVNDWNFTAMPSDNANENRFFAFAYCDYMPKFNTNNPKVREYLIDACEYWVKEYDIDALRLDVANEVCHDFCRELQARMRSLKKDFYIIGEIWHNSLPWLRGNEFDAIMNYPLQNAIYRFVLDDGVSSRDFEQDVNRCLTDYMRQTERVMFNLMDSHDTVRLVTKSGSKNRALQILAVMFAMPGSPCIYYGTEAFLEGGKDPDCRRCMPWKEIESGKCDDSMTKIKNLIALRKNNPAMNSESLRFIHNDGNDRLLCIEKTNVLNGEKLLLVSNFSGQKINVADIAGNSKSVFDNGFDGSNLDTDGVVILRLNEEVN